MMRKILYMALFVCLAVSSSAQAIAPLGSGLPAKPEKVAAFGDGLAAVYVDANQVIQIQVWNGDFWYALDTPPLPKAGMNTYGLLEIKDLKQINGKLYLCAEHTLDLMQNAPNFVLEWDGSKWVSFTGTLLNDALEIHQLIEFNGELQLVGIFKGDTTEHNILEYDGAWVLKGNLITRNIQNDKFRSVVHAHDKAYATGNFSNPAGNVSLVEWNGSLWQNTPFPAFLTANSTLGTYNNKLVVFGNNSFNDEVVKLQAGSSWQDISSGFDEYTIEDVTSFAQLNQDLYAFGDFKDSNNQVHHMMVYQENSWSRVEVPASVSSGTIIGSELVLVGTMNDLGRIKYIGKYHDDLAVVVAKVYDDQDGDCVKDANEPYLADYPVRFGTASSLMTDDNGAVYLTVPQETYQLNATAYHYWQPTCSDQNISISTIQTYDGFELGVKRQADKKDVLVTLADNQSFKYQNGEKKTALICASNIGSADVEDAIITLKHDNSLSNFLSTRTYDYYTNNEAQWTVDLQSDEALCFYVSFELSATEDISLDLSIALQTETEDADLGNNITRVNYTQGETLANQKHCNNGSVIKEDEEFMHYKIGFKNVGAGEAVDLKIVDVLDEHIVPSVQGVHYSYSHNCKALPVTYTVLPNGNWQYKFVWEYTDINLSNASGAASEGFLDFKVYIQPGTLEDGQKICNTAKLFYSYRKGTFNEPFSTNTVCSSVDDFSALPPQPQWKGLLKIGPVPSVGILDLSNNSGEMLELNITNALGQSLMSMDLSANSSSQWDVSTLGSGVYFIFANGQFAQQIILH